MQDEPRNSSFSTPGQVGAADHVELRWPDCRRGNRPVACCWRGCRRRCAAARTTASGGWPRARHLDLLPDASDRAPRAAGGEDLAALRVASRRTIAEPDHAAMAGDEDALALRSKYGLPVTVRRSPALPASCDVQVGLDHLGDQLVERRSRAPAELLAAPWRDRRSGGRPRSGGNSADRSRPGPARSRRRRPSRRRPCPASRSRVPTWAKALSTNSRTECVSPVAST